jgi:hypothetical protein
MNMSNGSWFATVFILLNHVLSHILVRAVAPNGPRLINQSGRDTSDKARWIQKAIR